MRPRGDDGSMIPMIIMAFVVAGLVVTGSIAAGSAFLAQRDVQSVCDGAAIAGAQALDPDRYFGGTGAPGGTYPLGPVQAAVSRYQTEDDSGAAMEAGLTGRSVVVRCEKTVHIPFGTVFGYGNGLDRIATAHAEPRMPTT